MIQLVNDKYDLMMLLLDLVNREQNFTVKLIYDDNKIPHHWEVEY